VVAFPLKELNAAYAEAVTADREVNVGGLLTSWNPMAHLEYWTDRHIIEPISDGIMGVWEAVNRQLG
ncbi:MAG: chemotaxis protein, partial [Phototrophicales bacterium]